MGLWLPVQGSQTADSQPDMLSVSKLDLILANKDSHPPFCRSLMAPKRTAPVGQVVAYGITRAVTILKSWKVEGDAMGPAGRSRLAERRRRFPRRVRGQTALPCPRPSGSATRNPQSAIRNPYQESAIRIRNPYRIYFLQGGYRAFLWQGLFAIRKIRTSVNPYRKSVIRIMNP